MPKVTQKGQVTIPQQIRIMLDIKTGDQVNFEVDAGTVYLRKKQASVENLKRYVGYLSHLKGKEPEDIIDELRDTADDFGR
ncbi:MAG: AbrB/MazE/SpoVT family DNA-binding domain-containing protein [Thermodesulfobacteriota bacterium]|nr:AbrB/MazE/SpoVT family DNA-binding domain-containing protein [Thermodesulfobacteriota bacterium]